MREHCIVVTRSASDQSGCLDISNRISALAKNYRLTVVSMAPLLEQEQRIYAVDYVAFPNFAGWLGWIMYLCACARFINRRRPARVVLLHSQLTPMIWLLKNVWVALYWNEHPSQFIFSHPRHTFMERIARRLVQKWVFFAAARQASLVMPIGKALYRNLLDEGCEPSQLRLIYKGLSDHFLCTPSNIDLPRVGDEQINLVYTGTVDRARGRLLLEGLAEANREQRIARLTIHGISSKDFLYYVRRALELGVYEDVSLAGDSLSSGISSLLSGMDAGLCLWEDRPWWHFDLPTKLFEYLAAGLPVLANDTSGHSRYIAEGHNGFIFECNAAAIAIAIRELWAMRMELPSLKSKAAESGRQYLWSEIEKRFLHEIAELNSGGRSKKKPAGTYDSKMRPTC